MRLIHAALPALLLAGVTGALVAQPGKPDPAAISGGTYTADPGHTLVKWEVDHLGFTPYFGIFGDITGTLQLDPKNPATAKVDVTIPVSKVTTASTGLTEHLMRAGKDGKPADFFGPNPADARFVSTNVVVDGQTAKITGDFTLNGVTKPVTLDARFYGAGMGMGNKENVGFTATGSIKRSDYGIGFLVPMVGDEVKLEIVAGFVK
ncbi:MAG: YceI family protein [Alphaproteobacteria bacterium]|nr:YceI family protein [Alphaproteobacteria bacterium]MBU0795518.1 YceI family protein [Alphaproteobacteria bacterium]MBU0874679.1 YceI family protein [Alphaproteobacteria bacterium]MBU1770087.1 YceI family protein [Alphaproteobacteria bacterium]